jgi:DNA-binding FrmR family transcriptional regulator
MLDASHQKDLAQRLRRIEGQVQGIQRMVAEQRDCIELLQQLAAVTAAVGRVKVAVFRFHARTCVAAAIRRGGSDRSGRIAELVDIVDQFC